mgnify:CR=1 FL=1
MLQPRDMTEQMFRGLSEPARQLFNELMASANSAAQTTITKAGYAILQEGKQLPEPLDQEILDAVDELKALGLDVLISDGGEMRCIQIRGVRVQGNRGEAAA